MASVIGICNSALVKLGDQTITSIGEANKRARLCNEQYPKMRDSVLRAHYWNFAKTRTSLAPLVTPPDWGFKNAFQLPADYSLIYKISGDPKYKIEGETIVCNADALDIIYIAKVTDTSLYDDMFAETLAWRLAADMAYAITQSQAVQNAMFIGYKQALQEARGMDAREGTPDPNESNTFFNSRF